MKAWITLLVLAPVAAAAQGLVLPGSTSLPPALPQGCSTATAGRATAYGCIPPPPARGPDGLSANPQVGVPGANSPPQALGLYNQAAVREQFGNQYGKSAVPQQLPPQHYTSPLVPPHQ